MIEAKRILNDLPTLVDVPVPEGRYCLTPTLTLTLTLTPTLTLTRRGAVALSLPNLWATFVLLFVVQCVTGLARILSGTGPWKLLYQEEPKEGPTPKA